LAGRILGPAEYGIFSLVQSVAMFLYVPMLLGFSTAMVKYNSEKEDIERQTKIISTAFIIVISLTVISSALYFLFRSHFVRMFSISDNLFCLAIILAVLFALYTITTETVRSLFKMKILAICQFAYPAILLSVFLLFVLTRTILSFKSMVYSTFVAYGIVSIVLLAVFLRKYLKLSFSKEWAGILSKYSLFAVVGSLSVVLYSNIDKILINKYMTTENLGVYKAYYMSSINLAGLFSVVFNTVFFPMASKYENKKILFHKISKLIPYVIAVGLPLIIVCEVIILKFYGKQYYIKPLWLILFAIASIIVVVDGLYGWFFNSIGSRGVKLTSVSAIVMALINILLNFIFIPLIGVPAAIVSIIISFAVCISLELILGRKYLR
jgi:O-antigen/teichoic acid export membrane protein